MRGDLRRLINKQADVKLRVSSAELPRQLLSKDPGQRTPVRLPVG